MIHPDFKFLRAVGMMIGGVIGVGVFGLPFAFAQSGFVIAFLELLLIAGVLILVQFMHGELALQTEGSHRLPGFVELYLGKFWAKISLVGICASVWGAMLAYMIIGGKFLFLLFSPFFGGSVVFYSYVLGGIAAWLIYRGLQFASKLEMFVVLSLLFLFVFMIILSVPHIQFQNILSVDATKWFLPYGIILFALSSVGIVPEMKDVLGIKAKTQLGKAILYGMSIVVVLYTIFAFAILGTTGSQTTSNAFDGLIPLYGNSFKYIASLLGSVTIVSIFMMLGIQLQNTFKFDLHFSKWISWFLTISVPFILFTLGVREFIELVGFIGSVFGGILGSLIVLSYLQLKKEPLCKERHCLNLPDIVAWLAIILFFAGTIFALFKTLL